MLALPLKPVKKTQTSIHSLGMAMTLCLLDMG